MAWTPNRWIAGTLGLFGELSRLQQMPVMLAIWLFQLWYSPLWLKHFRFGPLEWAWRCLTYFQIERIAKNGS